MAEKKKDPARVVLRNVRLSFADIYRAKAFGGNGNGGDSSGEKRFSANALIDPSTKDGKLNIEKMEDAIDYVKKNTWPKGAPKFGEAKLPLRDGNNVDYEGYEDMMFVSASNVRKPRILDTQGEDVVEGDDESPYSGCFCDMIVRVWGQDNKWGKRVNASLEGVRFKDDGEAFGAAPVDADDFDEDDDEPRGRGGRSRSRDDDDDDRGSSRGRGRGRSRDEDEEEETPRGRGRGRSRDEDDDDEAPRGRGRSRSRDNDDDEAPRGRGRSRSRDEDDDEAPRSRGRGRSRDEDEGEDERPARGSSRRRDEPDDEEDRPSRNSRSRRASADI